MDTATLIALAALVVGALGLALCVGVMSRRLPSSFADPLTARRHLTHPRRRRTPDGDVDEGERRSGRRRVVTGRSAAERFDHTVRPAGHPAMRPDVLRRERERLSNEQAREVVDQLADHPEHLVEVMDRLLAEDRMTHDEAKRP